MALGATVYKATIDVSDLDRDSYGNYVLTIARHPSETEERLMLRVLAFCRLAGERLEFGRGLSTEGEPALWEIDDTGAIVQWIEVGCPDVKQVRKAAGRSEHVHRRLRRGSRRTLVGGKQGRLRQDRQAHGRERARRSGDGACLDGVAQHEACGHDPGRHPLDQRRS